MGFFRYFCTKIENYRPIMAKKKKVTREKPASGFWEALGIKNILDNEIIWIFLGLIIVSIAIYFSVSFVSYLATGAEDQSMIEDPRMARR